MVEEMPALSNGTWEMVSLLSGKSVVGCRCRFTVEYNRDGSIERYMARLVAKGYTHTYVLTMLRFFPQVAKIA